VRSPLFGGDCFNYGQVASGYMDLVVEASLKPFDFAALVAIIAGAGGVCTDWQGRALRLDSDGHVIAAGDAGSTRPRARCSPHDAAPQLEDPLALAQVTCRSPPGLAQSARAQAVAASAGERKDSMTRLRLARPSRFSAPSCSRRPRRCRNPPGQPPPAAAAACPAARRQPRRRARTRPPGHDRPGARDARRRQVSPGFRNFDYADPNAIKGGDVRSRAIGSFDSFNTSSCAAPPRRASA
jgi:hypothetical protein